MVLKATEEELFDLMEHYSEDPELNASFRVAVKKMKKYDYDPLGKICKDMRNDKSILRAFCYLFYVKETLLLVDAAVKRESENIIDKVVVGGGKVGFKVPDPTSWEPGQPFVEGDQLCLPVTFEGEFAVRDAVYFETEAQIPPNTTSVF
jgi:hypothetical protein